MTINEPKFLTDPTLRRLGHWLRAAGYDTSIATAAETHHHYYLLRTAQHEGRLLLTRYDQLAEHRHAAGTVILLSSETLEECIKELCAFVSIDWQYNPFSRCIGCNQPVESAIASEQPQETHSYFCPTCNQVYWYNDLPHNQPRHAWPQKLSR